MLYADIIIDISHSRLDQMFQYKVPEELEGILEPGNVVEVPFGRGDHPKKGYVLQITEHPACPPEKLKSIGRIETNLAGAESKLTALALWIRDYYGSSTVQALRTVPGKGGAEKEEADCESNSGAAGGSTSGGIPQKTSERAGKASGGTDSAAGASDGNRDRKSSNHTVCDPSAGRSRDYHV